MNKQELPTVHPGEVLFEEFLKPMDISQSRLAKDINVPARRINEIVHGKRSVSADTALRLGRYFGIDPQFWLNLQSHYDLEVEKDRLADRLESEVRSSLQRGLESARQARAPQVEGRVQGQGLPRAITELTGIRVTLAT